MKLTGARVPALDGLRGVAVLLVVASHAQVPGFRSGGTVGVTMFFALSGFLITTLLLEEQSRTDKVSLRGFFARRARRLLPALAVLIAVMLAVRYARPGEALAVIAYYGNWIRAAGGGLEALSHTWSLAIEEQFYLVWPLLMIFAGRRRRVLAGVAVAGAVYAMVARVVLWDGGAGMVRVYFGTDTRADAILLGCLLALVSPLGVPGWRWVPWGLTAGLVALSATTSTVLLFVVLPGVVAVLTVALIASVVDGWAPLEGAVIRYVGRRSYALYLWHVPLLQVVPVRVGMDEPWFRAAMVVASFVLAEVSWRLVERPAMRWRRSTDEPVGHDRVAVQGGGRSRLEQVDSGVA